jgi:cysteine desulfurase family protein
MHPWDVGMTYHVSVMSSTRRLYLDNAATSFPKPSCVLEAMHAYATGCGASPGRGAYAEAREATERFNQCRDRINTLIGGSASSNVIFTLNTTDALNLAIHGLIHRDARRRHVITTDLDHNSVLRPFNYLVQHEGVEQTRVPCDPLTGRVDPEDIRRAIRPDTGLIAVVHGSNVTGTLQPVTEIGRIAREHAVPFLVDAAQTIGHIPIDVEMTNIDLLAAPGHKGLLGPLGTGFLYIRPGLEKQLRPIRQGGTGSVSERDSQPDFMPDRFEPGSHNAPGLIGLNAAVGYLLEHGVDTIWQHEQSLIKTMIEGLSNIDGLRYLGPQGVQNRCGVFSVVLTAANLERSDESGLTPPLHLANTLEHDFGILTRAGLHCAPHAHRTMNTHATGGATRLSVGPFVSVQDVKYACDALAHIADRAIAHA